METFEYSEGGAEPVWPEFYPDGIELPPSDSADTEGVYYRLVNHSPPQEGCFLTTHEEQPERYRKYERLGDMFNLQNVYGMSVFNNADRAIEARDKFPDALGHKMVAEGNLEPSMGKMRQYPRNPSHFAVWLKRLISPYENFTVVEGDS